MKINEIITEIVPSINRDSASKNAKFVSKQQQLDNYRNDTSPARDSSASFIGQNSTLWDPMAAEDAIELEKQGESRDMIQQATGTTRLPNGTWAQEISDSSSTLLDKWDAAKDMKLGDFYNNPAFYEAYPELKDIGLTIYDNTNELTSQGWANNVKVGIAMYDTKGNLRTEADMLQTLKHEGQHLIQTREPDFGSGSSSKYTLDILADLEKDGMAGNERGIFPTQYMMYRSKDGEQVSQEVGNRGMLTPAQLRNTQVRWQPDQPFTTVAGEVPYPNDSRQTSISQMNGKTVNTSANPDYESPSQDDNTNNQQPPKQKTPAEILKYVMDIEADAIKGDTLRAISNSKAQKKSTTSEPANHPAQKVKAELPKAKKPLVPAKNNSKMRIA